MTRIRAVAVPLLLALALLAAPGHLRAAEPQPLSPRVFDVHVEGGVVNVTFALALSDAPTYPVLISAIGGSVEEALWEGMLPEGFYSFQAPLTKITSGPLKIVLRTRITIRSAQGPQNAVKYLVWEGTTGR
jgi:hypothetical protein